MANIYIARKKLKVGNTVYRPGDAVPEARGWRNLHSYISSGALVLVQTTVKESVKVKQKIPLSPASRPWDRLSVHSGPDSSPVMRIP